MSPAILFIVEDDYLLQQLLQDELTDAGFEVRSAKWGVDAFAALDDDAGRFRAIIIDADLARLPNGWDVARKARELVHDIPVIYTTGGNAHMWASLGVPNSVLITKPFVGAQIITALANLLAEVDANRATSQ